MLAHADGAWKQTPSAEQLLANTTAASVARTQLRIKVGEAPTASELCAFGRALPAKTMTIIITGSRQQRIAAAGEAMCLPNVHVINGHPPINDEAEITPSERSLFMDGSMEVLTLGEIAIHISHQRALADCLQIQKGDAPCLILEDDFSLSGPLVADRFTAAFDQLPASWDLLFLGRCMDNECGSGGLRISAAADLYGVAAHSYPVGLTDYHVVKEKDNTWLTAAPKCLHAYMVTVRGASRLSQAMSVTPAPADLAPAIMAGMDYYKDTYADGGAKSHQGKSVGAAKTAATSVSLTGIYSIAPQIMNQAAALRLQVDSGATATAKDTARGILVDKSNKKRSVFVMECAATTQVASVPASAAAPWFRGSGGVAAGGVARATILAYAGYNLSTPTSASASTALGASSEMNIAALLASVETAVRTKHADFYLNASSLDLTKLTPKLTACRDLKARLTRDGARTIFEDATAWMAGYEAIDAHVSGCALQLMALVHQLIPAATSWARERALAVAPYRCPIHRTGMSADSQHKVSQRIFTMHAVAESAGFQETAWACKAAVDGKTSLACMPTPEADDWIWSIRFAETRGWPRPPVCSYKEVSRLNYQTRYTKRERLTKLVNGGRALEYRPMLKSGSTYFRSLLTCLQPGEWAVVKEATPMPANHSSIVLVREHTRRFVSAVSEVMRRIFASQCPGGPCSSGADDYYTEGKHDSADALARKSSWYRHALRLYSGQVGEAERNQTIRELLAAAVTDSGCFLSYYGAEHMMTQSQLMAQGSATLQARADDTSQHGFILRLEDLGRDAESLQRSSLLRIIGASHLPRDAIGSCAAQATEAEHNTRSAAEELEATGQGAELVGQGGSDEAASYSLLPTEEAMHAVLMGDDGLLISLCQIYAQDMLCLASEYDVPEACAALLSVPR